MCRPREVEEKMTDDERVSLLISTRGQHPQVTSVRDENSRLDRFLIER